MNPDSLLLVLGVTIYILGLILTGAWVFLALDHGEANGTPWIPRACRTQACCVCRLLLVIAWPTFLLCIAVYSAIKKCLHATTCYGRDSRRTRLRKTTRICQCQYHLRCI